MILGKKKLFITFNFHTLFYFLLITNFNHVSLKLSKLNCTMLNERTVYMHGDDQYKRLFIDNTNLHSLRGHCFGTLVAYTDSNFRRSRNYRQAVNVDWQLCVILHLHPHRSVLCPCKYSVKDSYELIFDEVFFVSMTDEFQLRYLNRVTENLLAMEDGCFDSNVNGPDIIIQQHSSIPSTLLERIKKIRKSQPALYTFSKHSFAKRNKFSGDASEPNTEISLKKGNFSVRWRSTSRINAKTMKVNSIHTEEVIVNNSKCYAFPLLNNATSSSREFAFLSESRASNILSMEKYLKEKYERVLREQASVIMTMTTTDVPEDGLNIEVVDDMEDCEHIKVEHDKRGFEAFEREGVLHGKWNYSDTFKVNDWRTLIDMILHVFGDYGFKRPSTSCMGLNVYAGLKGAEYVRPTPQMSKGAVLLSQYFRKNFNPTFMPLIYKLINQLSQDAGLYQTYSDRIYDRFQSACWKRIEELEKAEEDAQEDKEEAQEENNDSKLPAATIVPRKRRKINHDLAKTNKRFASLSILTGGNSKISGFANMPHFDMWDLWSKFFTQKANEYLDELVGLQFVTGASPSFVKAINHLKRHSVASYTGSFSSYTTCGYQVTMNDRIQFSFRKFHLCFFLYLNLGIAVNIPANRTCYHMFGGALCQHLTAVPITVDHQYVRFNDKDLYVLAWGNGRSETRIYIEQQTGRDLGHRLTQQDIRDFYNVATQEQRAEVVRLGFNPGNDAAGDGPQGQGPPEGPPDDLQNPPQEPPGPPDDLQDAPQELPAPPDDPDLAAQEEPDILQNVQDPSENLEDPVQAPTDNEGSLADDLVEEDTDSQAVLDELNVDMDMEDPIPPVEEQVPPVEEQVPPVREPVLDETLGGYSSSSSSSSSSSEDTRFPPRARRLPQRPRRRLASSQDFFLMDHTPPRTYTVHQRRGKSFGLQLETILDSEGREAGAYVLDEPANAASTNGIIHKGHVIQDVNGRTVSSAEQVHHVLDELLRSDLEDQWVKFSLRHEYADGGYFPPSTYIEPPKRLPICHDSENRYYTNHRIHASAVRDHSFEMEQCLDSKQRMMLHLKRAPAHWPAFKDGDIVMSINDHPVTRFSDYRKAMASVPKGDREFIYVGVSKAGRNPRKRSHR